MRWPLAVGACLVVLLAAGSGCDEDSWDCDCSLVVSNDSACDLTIFVDGVEVGDVPAHETRHKADIGCDDHTLEARNGAGENVELRHVHLHSCEDYYWRIDDC